MLLLSAAVSNAENRLMAEQTILMDEAQNTEPDFVFEEEIWVNIGKAYWEDPFWQSNSGSLQVYLDMEKSVQHPDTYRVEFITGEYIYIHTDNRSRVFISPYSCTNGAGQVVTVIQSCPENGFNESKYGSLVNGKVTIPGNYFIIYFEGEGYGIGNSSRKCEIIFPEGFENPVSEEEGVFMGIIGFNDELTRKPISLLDENTKQEFTSFVNGLTMGNATLLYYAVDQAIISMLSQKYPSNLSKVMLLTFTDGLDQGSLAMNPQYRTSVGYADYLSRLISATQIKGIPLEAYALGLKSEDVYDDELFMYNLQSLTSDNDHITSVSNISEMQQKLTEIVENLNQESTQRIVTIKVPVMSHGDRYRFTLDHSRSAATNSNIWFEGVFNIDDMSLENVIYNGFSSVSGTKLIAKQEGIKLTFTLNDCRDLNGNILDVDKDGIDQWQFIQSRGIWNHNIENAKADDIDIEEIKSSIAIMFALDCSTSLGDLFPLVKSTANSFIDRLAGGSGETGLEDIIIDANEDIDINDPSVEIYNLQGIRVENPASGIYICRKGLVTKKIVIR